MIWYRRTVRSSDETWRTSACVYCVAAMPFTTSRSLAVDRLRISIAALIVPSSAGKRDDHEAQQDQAGQRAGAEGRRLMRHAAVGYCNERH